MKPIPLVRRAMALAATGLAATAIVPAAVSAHSLTGRYESPLPLEAYLAAAAVAVGLSFAIVLLRRPAPPPPDPRPSRVSTVPGWFVMLMRAVGLIAWLWIMAQALVGSTNSDADVASLFLWTYGWVVLPLVCAFIGPAWDLLDPFVTLHDLGAGLLHRLRLRGWRAVEYPERFGVWPAVIAFTAFVWLELVLQIARGGRPLALIVLGYTAFTLVMMAQFGRDTWRARGEAFTVWFRLAGRLAPLAWLPGDEGRRLGWRRIGDGLLTARWTVSEVALVAASTGAILYDGLSQTQIFFDILGVPSVAAGTVYLIGFLALIALAAIGVSRVVGLAAMGAGLLPIALGYLIAHYVTSVLLDSQRIVTVLSDPFQLGWNLLGTAGYEPDDSWLPGAAVWAIQLVAVVGGHVLGAWYGHRAALESGPLASGRLAESAQVRPSKAPKRARRSGAASPAPVAAPPRAAATEAELREVRLRQLPLAILMVLLTTLTLWSLGQALVTHVGGGILG